MLSKIKNYFMDKSVFYFLLVGSGLLALISSIVFYVLDVTTIKGNITFTDDSLMTFIFMLIGVAGCIFAALTKFKFAPLIPVIFFALGFSQNVVMACFPAADILKGVPFFTSNMDIANSTFRIFLIFGILFFISLVLSIIYCFASREKKR